MFSNFTNTNCLKIWTVLLLFILPFVSFGQSVPLGMNYQAIARDAQGLPIANQGVYLKISLTSADDIPEVYYQETHEAQTDELGLFNLVIGKGDASGKSMLDIPWAKGNIWISMEMATDANPKYQLVSNTQLLAVPYALQAETADKLIDKEATLRNQSIYWNTSGNKDSRPDFHFLGTRDDKDFVIKTNDIERFRYREGGQLVITAGVLDGKRDDESKGSYPMTVEGSNQGIYIKVDENRTSANNFVTFADPVKAWGAIEGQTYQELITSRNYIIEATLFAIKITSLGVQIAGGVGEATALAVSIVGVGAGVAEVFDFVAKIITAASLATQLAAWIAKNAVCVGVKYKSGGADYAEYLLRDGNSRDIHPAEIVGVNGGVVSLDTKNADHIMVASSNPIVLGNMPAKELEPLYEKIAFMGQVPVRVVGPVSEGDYILPSGNNDGMGVAVCPDDMQLGDYPHILGVSWESADDKLLNIVNVAIGINAEDMSQRADLLNRQVDNITDFLEGKAQLITDPNLLQVDKDLDLDNHSFQKAMSDEEFMTLIEENSGPLIDVFDRAKKILDAQGFDFANTPGLEELFENPITFIREVRNSPEYTTQWSFADKKLLEFWKEKD